MLIYSALVRPFMFAAQAAGVVRAEQASAEGPSPGGQGARPSLQPQFGACHPEDAEGGRKNQVRHQWPKLSLLYSFSIRSRPE
jgi:hypothetical protein